MFLIFLILGKSSHHVIIKYPIANIKGTIKIIMRYYNNHRKENVIKLLFYS
jgi:hypothetical protein